MKLIFSKFKSNPWRGTLYAFLFCSLFAYLFSIPTFGENTTGAKYIIYAALGLLTISSFIYSFLYVKIKFPKVSILIPLFCVFAIIGTIYYSKDFRGWLSLVFLTVSFFSLYLAFTAIGNKFLVISLISIAFGLFGCVFIFYFRDSFIHISSLISSKLRLGYPFDNPNGIAAYAVVGLATSLYLVLFLKKKTKYLFLIPCLVSFVVGLSTGSRSFFVMAFLFVLILLYFAFQRYKTAYFISLGVLIVLSIILLSLPFMENIRDRLFDAIGTIFGLSSKTDKSTMAREIYIDYGFYYGTKNMLIGYGVSGFSLITGLGTYSHSNFSEVACNFGIFGFALFYAPLVILLVKSLLNKKVDRAFIVSFVAYYLIISFTNVLYYKKVYYLILAFMFYLVYYLPTLNNKTTKEKLNICFAVDSMASGGAERVVSTLSNELVKLGHNVNILIVSCPDDSSFYKLDERVKVFSIVKDVPKKVNIIKRVHLLRKYYKSVKPDVLISFLKHICIYNWIASNPFDFKVVVSERNDPSTYSKMEKFLVRRAFYAADKCIFQTHDALKWYGQDIEYKSSIIFNPVNLIVEPKKVKQEREKTIVSVGRLEKQKNIFFLVDVFDKFSKTHDDYKLKIYGEGSLKNEINKYIEQKGLNKKVSLLGNNSSWQKDEINAGCFVLTSSYEGMPNALEEAACLKIPCVSSNCKIGGPYELSKLLSNILLVDNYNVDDYCEAISAAIILETSNVDCDELLPNRVVLQWLKVIYE